MNFRPEGTQEEPEINLIPLIDVLLVILIFLAASTSFTQQRQLNVSLPQAQADAIEQTPTLNLAISRDGLYALNGSYVNADSDQALADALQQAAAAKPDATLSIDADRLATHGSVVRALEAARLAHITRVHFLTQDGP
ncbi:MAG TPA: biopolymer transporter ExbD [Castellaniella sp.]|uniref:ExbD/TolR family protein n=1 Tax=Castellaniella sp. TaxID=1955812 RepID=UPI002EEB4B21